MNISDCLMNYEGADRFIINIISRIFSFTISVYMEKTTTDKRVISLLMILKNGELKIYSPVPVSYDNTDIERHIKDLFDDLVR